MGCSACGSSKKSTNYTPSNNIVFDKKRECNNLRRRELRIKTKAYENNDMVLYNTIKERMKDFNYCPDLTEVISNEQKYGL